MSAAERVRARHATAVRGALPDRAARLAAERLATWAAQLATERAWAAFATLNPTAPGARAARPGARRWRLVAAEQAASLGRRAVAALVAENQADRRGASGAVVARARLAKQRRYDLVRQAGPPAWQAPSAARAAPAAPAASGAEGGRWWARAACRDLDPELFTAATTPARVRRAKRVCAPCPVRPECLAEALAVPTPRSKPAQYDVGVIAGTTPDERAHLRARARREGGRGAA